MDIWIPAALTLITLATIGVSAWTLYRNTARRESTARQAFEEMEKRLILFRDDINKEIFNQSRLLTQHLNNFGQSLTSSLTHTQQSVQTDLNKSSRLMSDIHGKLGELGEASKRIHEVGKDIAGLQDLLRAPKLRGGIGEYFLADLLGQILPRACFELQYRFQNGQIVDAVIHAGNQLVSIDSKFPLESFRQLRQENDPARQAALRKDFTRAVKKHIDDIAAKYIRPDEGTYNFALMYIPAENVYYEASVRGEEADGSSNEIFEHAIRKNVMPVSPNSFYAYLQVILMGLRGLQIESRAQEILGRLQGLKMDFEKFEAEFNLLGRHLSNSGKSFEKVQSQLSQFASRLRVVGETSERELLESDARALPAAENAPQ